MMHRNLLIVMLFLTFLILQTGVLAIDYPQITEQGCGFDDEWNMISCPEKLECYGFPNTGKDVCAQPNPCSYYQCPDGTFCSVQETWPATVKCSNQAPPSPLAKKDSSVAQDKQIIASHASEKDDIIKANFASVKHSDELIVENSKVFMLTTSGKRVVNIMPDAAIFISETPNKELIKSIELNEELRKPVYFVTGIKYAKLLFIAPASIEIKTEIDAETGEIISVKKPWWSFLAW